MGTVKFASTLNEIHSISTKAILGGVLVLVCCVLASSLLNKSDNTKHYIYLTIVGIIALVTGVLIATALFVTNNPNLMFRDFEL